MTMFGAIYYIVPRVTGVEWPCAKSVRAHFWLAAIGIVLLALPLALGGVREGMHWNDPTISSVYVAKAMLPFLRASTLGELLILAGHLLLLLNLFRLSACYARTHFLPVVKDATAVLKPAEARP
jgi:cytochrome c oxidase cbb3-type subunit 1